LEALDRAGRDLILDWIFSRTGDGATVVVVSHEIEPFAERAAWAAGASGADWQKLAIANLGWHERRATLEKLARGAWEPNQPGR
jgi:hypothetical protein